MEFGDRNLMGTGTYPSDPTAGATMEGLAPGVVTVATNSYAHPFPFQPGPGAYPGTDQIFTGGPDTIPLDGYTHSLGTVAGSQALTFDYSSLVPAGHKVDTLTLGIAADDFQQPAFREPFTAKINGIVDSALSNQLNALDLSGPKVQFLSVGIDAAILAPSNILSLSVERGGTGGDGWAVDFATIGVTTSVPEPSTFCVLAFGVAGLALRARRPRAAA